jgi:hypothetical protein
MEDYNKGGGFNLKDDYGDAVKKNRGNNFSISNILWLIPYLFVDDDIIEGYQRSPLLTNDKKHN